MSTHQEQVENAICDPTRHYASPMDVVNDESLDAEEKRKILESWKKDAELLSTAQAENMAGGERPQLQDVSLALNELNERESLSARG
ncbi:MAG TPA: hypothetical protein VFO35_21840 [Steroidobacteraceae bacterium]|nr:hypothetical protein [Steroidobacteraceae bacterium]